MSSRDRNEEEEADRSLTVPPSISPNIEVVTSPTLEEKGRIPVVPPKESPARRERDLRSDPEKAEDLE
jgi:hypothetical protein